jgi:hypothetical protein
LAHNTQPPQTAQGAQMNAPETVASAPDDVTTVPGSCLRAYAQTIGVVDS